MFKKCKSLFSVLVLAGSCVLGVRAALADPVVAPILRNAPVDNIFAPVGFDDNDDVELILHGHFSNSCNKIGPAIGIVDSDTFEITVSARALTYSGNNCIEMQIPFTQTVKLGQLKAGTYTIQMNKGTESLSKTLVVETAKSNTADDALYAPVDTVEFFPSATEPGSYEVHLSGLYPKSNSGCMSLQSVKVLPFDDVLVVLPIAKFEPATNNKCLATKTSFDRKFRAVEVVKIDLKKDTLIHVRVLNGQSLNRVIEVDN
jgi:hypothetical protein